MGIDFQILSKIFSCIYTGPVDKFEANLVEIDRVTKPNRWTFCKKQFFELLANPKTDSSIKKLKSNFKIIQLI